MGNIKTLKYILAGFLMTFLYAGCTEELTYTPGAEEEPDNYGVYFPTQTSPTELDLDPSEETEVTYRIRRTRYTDAITVPVVVEASQEGIFEIDPIVFGPGEQETEFTVSFPKAERGTEYSCVIRIEDPKYISIYGTRATSLSFSVVRAGWVRLTGANGETTGKWRDNTVCDMYSLNTSGYNPYPEIDVEIYEREDIKGYYRMKVYGEALMSALSGGGTVNYTSRDVWTTVDASDPAKVYIPYQTTGLTLLSDDGELRIGSSVAENFSMDASASQYGTLENGVITFPAQSIMLELTNNAGSFYYGNREGMLRIMLPGYTAPDYTVTLTKGAPADGAVEITATFAADVSEFKYSIVRGTLDDGTASLRAQELDRADGFDESIMPDGTSKVIRVENLSTDKYTLVGAAYDETGEMHGYAYIPFGYIAQGDDRPVKLKFGLEATYEYAGQGINPDNSAKFYAYFCGEEGEEIESVRYGLFRTSRLAGRNQDEVLDEEGTDFTDEQMEQLNEGHFSVMLTGLNGDSGYTLLLRASNGYVTEILSDEITTTGKFNPGLEVFYYEDFLDADPQTWSVEYLTGSDPQHPKEWNYYAYNFNDENAVRRYIGKVTMSVNETISDDVTTILDVEGLSGIEFEEGGQMLAGHMPSSTYFNGYEGVIALSPNPSQTNIYDGSTVTIGFIDALDPVYIYYSQYYYMFFGAVADGYLYCVPSPILEDQGYSFSFLFTGSQASLYCLMGEMMLVDPAKDMGGLPGAPSAAAQARMAAIRSQALKGRMPRNYVELPEFSTAPGGMAGNGRPALNLAVNPMPASAPASEKASATITVRTAEPGATAAHDGTVSRTGVRAKLAR